MKIHYLVFATIAACAVLSGCRTTSEAYDDPADYNAASESIYGSPQAYDMGSSSGRTVSSSSSSEEPYDKGRNAASSTTAVKSSFGSDQSQQAPAS